MYFNHGWQSIVRELRRALLGELHLLQIYTHNSQGGSTLIINPALDVSVRLFYPLLNSSVLGEREVVFDLTVIAVCVTLIRNIYTFQDLNITGFNLLRHRIDVGVSC